MSIVSFSRRRWGQRNLSERETYAAVTKVKMCLAKYEDYEKYFSCLRRWRGRCPRSLSSLLMIVASVQFVARANGMQNEIVKGLIKY